MLKAVIMDFDGVIIDTETIWHQVTTAWFKKNHHYDLPMQEFLLCVGSVDEQLFRFLETTRGLVIDRDRFKADNLPAVREKSAHLPVKAGVIDFIDSVKAAGLGLALATSSGNHHAHSHLERLGLKHRFDVIVTKDDVQQVKPHPDLFLLAAQKLGVTGHEAVIIEDSANGLQAGIAAGIPVINIPNAVTKYLDFTGAYQVLEKIADVDLSKLIHTFE